MYIMMKNPRGEKIRVPKYLVEKMIKAGWKIIKDEDTAKKKK